MCLNSAPNWCVFLYIMNIWVKKITNIAYVMRSKIDKGYVTLNRNNTSHSDSAALSSGCLLLLHRNRWLQCVFKIKSTQNSITANCILCLNLSKTHWVYHHESRRSSWGDILVELDVKWMIDERMLDIFAPWKTFHFDDFDHNDYVCVFGPTKLNPH